MPTSGDRDDVAAGLPPTGGSIGKYQLVRVIGRGGMGMVHEAVHPELRKRVAIKTLLPAMATVPGTLQRFLQEGEAASRIKHPNVVNILDVGTHQGLPFLVMEYLEGESLAARFARQPAGPMDELVDLMLPAIAAVATGHDVGVIHRDLKPANIFLEHDRRGEVTPKVLDFGISKLVGAPTNLSLTGNAAMLGTLSYMAPEQAENARAVDGRADQYAFGLILYEGLTGHRAFSEKIGVKVLLDIASGRLDPPRLIRFEIPAALEAVVLRALRVAPAERYPSLRALGAALLPFASPRQRLLWETAFAEKTLSAPPMARTIPLLEVPNLPSVPPSWPAAAPPPPAAPPTAWDPPSTTFRRAAGEAPRSAEVATDVRPRRRWLAGVAAGAVVVGVAIVVASVLAPRAREPRPLAVSVPLETRPVTPLAPTSTYEARTSVEPANALIELDGEPVGRGTFHRALPADGRSHRLHLTLDGYEPQTFTFDDGHALPAQITLAPATAAAAATAAPPVAASSAAPASRRDDKPASRRSSRRAQRSREADLMPARPAAKSARGPRRSVNNAPILH